MRREKYFCKWLSKYIFKKRPSGYLKKNGQINFEKKEIEDVKVDRI